MKNKLTINCLLVLLGTVTLFVSVRAADVQRYLVTKGQDFTQTNATTTVSLTNQLPFRFVSTVDATAPDSVLQAKVKLPNLQIKVLTNSGDGNFDFEQGYVTKALLDASYAAGNYVTFMVGTNDHTNTPTLALAADNYPNIPKIGNWVDLQSVEAAQPLNLTWNSFTNGTASDFIMVDISDTNGNSIASTPAMLSPGALDGTAVSAQIPAAALVDDTTYVGSLLFVKRTLLNTTSYPGANGVAGYYRQTRFPLVTLPTPPAEGRIQFEKANYYISETNQSVNMTITRSGSNGLVSVDYIQPRLNLGGISLIPPPTTVSFADGETSKTLLVFNPYPDNYVVDGDKSFNVSLFNPQGGAVLGNRSSATVNIKDNEIAGAGTLGFSVTSYTVAEAAKLITLTINRTGGSIGTVSVDYATGGIDAFPGLNYVETNGTLVFAPGVVSKTITVQILNDTLYEANERFTVGLSNPTGGAVIGNGAQVSIINDDFGGTFAFKQNSYITNENSTNFVVTVVRTGGTASGVTVDYYTQDGSAQADVRYFATNGTLTFGANELSKSFLVGITNDFIPNGNQSFFVVLTNATGGAKVTNNPAWNTASLTIKDDESSIAFSNTVYAVNEAAGTLAITVFRTGALLTQVSVDYHTEDQTATAGQDYTAVSGTLTFPPNVPAKTFTIPIINDTIVEGNETFALHLTNPQGGVALGFNTDAVVTIVDNDFGGAISFGTNTYTVSEAGTNALITLVRSNGIASGVSVDLVVSDGTATAGVDYANISQTLNFNAGETNKKVLLPVFNNTIVDGTRTVLLSLQYPAGGASLGVRPNATLNITDNDLGGVINFSRPTYSQFESGTNFYVSVTRSGGKASGVSVDYFTQDGAALDGVRYHATSGTLTFAANETNKVIAVGIINDLIPNGNQSFTLNLTNATGGATLGNTNVTTLTVLDDESSIGFSSATYATNETAGNLIVTIVRTGLLATPATVTYYTLGDSTANVGVNFTSVSNTLAFPVNVPAKTFLVPLINNTLAQGNVLFHLYLTNATGGAALGVPQASATIIDDDRAGTIGFAATNYFVSDVGTNAVITVTRSNGLASGITVNFQTQDGTAVDGVDYTNATQVLTFAAGETSKKVLVPITKKTSVDVNRSLTLRLQSTGSAVLTRDTALLNIVENRTAIGVEFAGYSANKTSTNILVRFVRTGLASSSVSASYSTVNGTAIAPTDYKTTTGTVIFPANTNSRTISIPIVTNSPSPGGRIFNIRLAAPVGCILGPVTNSAITILDSVSGPSFISFSAVNYLANKTNASVLVTLTRSGGLSDPASVNIFSTDGTATIQENDPYKGLLSYDLTGFGDYEHINNNIGFDSGVSSVTVAITLLNNPIGGIRPSDGGSNRWFTCSLAFPAGNFVQLGNVTNTRVEILDTLKHGTVQFSAASYTASAATGNADITLERTGGSDGIVSFHFLPYGDGDSAQPGADYDLFATNTGGDDFSNNLVFQPGETNKTISLTLFVNNATAYPKSAHLSLNTPEFFFGATLGTVSNAVLNITP